MSKLKLLFPFGGESAEHEVSVDSAKYVYSLLNKDLYDITLCFVDRDGRWWHIDSFDDNTDPARRHELTMHLGRAEVTDSAGWSLHPDAILPIMLGPNGEDGSVQGLAQLLHLPVIGCGITGSAICMDKLVTKRLLQHAGIPVADYLVHYKGQAVPSFEDVVQHLGKTVFIKPAGLGSSVGVAKADTAEAFTRGLSEAHVHDHKVLIERAVSGIEVGCGIIGNSRPEASVVSKIQLGDNDFFTYDAKYAAGSTAHMIIPADLPRDTTEKIRAVAIQAYQTLECRGFARVDMFLTDDGEVLVNELNTLPAFRSDSSYPKLWKATHMDPAALWDRIIGFALEESTFSESGKEA